MRSWYLQVNKQLYILLDLFGRETGSNKQAASKSCALSMVRQLYHLNVIEAYSGVVKKKTTEEIPPFDVAVSEELSAQVDAALNVFNMPPNPVVCRNCI